MIKAHTLSAKVTRKDGTKQWYDLGIYKTYRGAKKALDMLDKICSDAQNSGEEFPKEITLFVYCTSRWSNKKLIKAMRDVIKGDNSEFTEDY